jgi:hypothetical protein
MVLLCVISWCFLQVELKKIAAARRRLLAGEATEHGWEGVQAMNHNSKLLLGQI